MPLLACDNKQKIGSLVPIRLPCSLLYKNLPDKLRSGDRTPAQVRLPCESRGGRGLLLAGSAVLHAQDEPRVAAASEEYK